MSTYLLPCLLFTISGVFQGCHRASIAPRKVSKIKQLLLHKIELFHIELRSQKKYQIKFHAAKVRGQVF